MGVPQFTRIGFCVKSHGVKGQLKIEPDEGYEKVFGETKAFFFDVNGSMVPHMVIGKKPIGDGWLFTFKRIQNKEDAGKHSESPVYVESHLVNKRRTIDPKPLVGWTLMDTTSETSMIIERVEDFPQQIMLICNLEDEEVLIPLVEEWLVDSDPIKQYICFALPEGMLL